MSIPADARSHAASGADAAAQPLLPRPLPDDAGGADLNVLQALSDAAREMHRSLSLAEVLRVATDRARQIMGAAESATTHGHDRDWSRALTVTASTSGDPVAHLSVPSANRRGREHEVCRTNQPLRELAWLAAPLVASDGRNMGLIQLAGKVGGGDFSPADEAMLMQLARIASVAIENARLYQAAVDTRGQLALAATIERVRAAELRAVINAMGEAVLVCDADGRVDFANVAADRLFAGRPVATYDDLLSRFAAPPGGPIDPAAGPVEISLVGQADRWVELRVYPVRGVTQQSAEGVEVGGRIALLRDVTTARQARQQREAFLGILSHELRTPITTIYAGSKVLAREDRLDRGTSRDLANDISGEAERLFRLVEDLLVMTRIERGVLHLAHEPVLLQRVAAIAIRLESAHWPARIQLADEADLPAVEGDATYVEQVLRNLLSNAAKYSPADAEVVVRLQATDDEVICRVLDRGRGFQSDEAEDLFDLFYRSPATAAQAAGAGIGLFVCRRLVQAMGGRIWARPRPGGGSEFGFALRRYDEGSEDE
ncbi:MAG TPA: ATP-binding protein [Vitreimonas sp.]|nr:ATP-binding protein [Vitreimonas sp.]